MCDVIAIETVWNGKATILTNANMEYEVIAEWKDKISCCVSFYVLPENSRLKANETTSLFKMIHSVYTKWIEAENHFEWRMALVIFFGIV